MKWDKGRGQTDTEKTARPLDVELSTTFTEDDCPNIATNFPFGASRKLNIIEIGIFCEIS